MAREQDFADADILDADILDTVAADQQRQRIQDIYRLYPQYLGRVPDQGGLEFYSNPDFSLALIEQDIANSAEAKDYAAKQTATPVPAPAFDNRASLTELYESVLRRSPDEAGFNFWLDALNQGYSPQFVEQQFYASPEYQQLINPPAPAPSLPVS